MITGARLTGLLATFPNLTVGLIGDLFLDRYLEMVPGVEELSLETGLEAYQIERVRNSPGALGTVMNNLTALGVGRLEPVTVIGDDGHGYDLLRALESPTIDRTHVLRCPDRLTPTYTKPLRPLGDGGWHEVNRLDVRTRAPLSADTSAAVSDHVRQVFEQCDGLIVLDQISEENHGVVNAPVRSDLERLAVEYPAKLMYIDSRRLLRRFGFGVLKGNQSEICAAADDERPAAAAVALSRRTGRPVFCTQGERGCLVAHPDGRTETAPAFPVSGPIDIVGAGDSATAGMVLSLLAGATEYEAATVGNLVASITVQQIGTTGTASPQQVLARWEEVRG